MNKIVDSDYDLWSNSPAQKKRHEQKLKNNYKEIIEKMKKIAVMLCALSVAGTLLSTGCGAKKEKVTIYTSTEDYNMEYMQKCLNEKFPNYDIVIEYMSTSNIAAKVIEEGESSDCDIVFAEEYGYLEKMIGAGVLDSLEGDYDLSRYLDDTVPTAVNKYVLPNIRSGGGIVINNTVLQSKGLQKPTSYADLLDPAYKDLVSMASPKSSGTGYMFLYSLVNAWGENEALSYFDSLTPNILAYTTSGSGPVNALVGREAAVGFGMISQAVTKINDGNNELEILFFEEGAPFNLYGNAIVKGKKANHAVKEVMDYFDSYYTNESNRMYYPEPVLKNTDYNIPNFPANIKYANMVGNNLEAKERLLAKWNH